MTYDNTLTERIRAANALADTIRADGIVLQQTGRNWIGCCPFHPDNTPSFTVYTDQHRYFCFGCRASGDVFAFVMGRHDVPFAVARDRLGRAAGILPLRPTASEGATQLSLPKLELGSDTDFRVLARRRGLSTEGLRLASDRGLLRFANLRGFDAYVVTDTRRINAQARRLDGQKWEHISAKAWTLRGSRAGWPLGVLEAVPYQHIALVEGGPDLLAAFHFIYVEGRENDTAPVAVMGASLSLPDDALGQLTEKTVRVYPHLDASGRKAADRWMAQLEAAGVTSVDAFNVSGLSRSDGLPVEDLNDLAMVSADDYEAEYSLREVLP